MIAFDTETTGLLLPEACDEKMQPFLIEIYLCKFDWDGNILDEFDTLIKPPVMIPEKITSITGITNGMVKNSPKFIEIYEDLCEFVEGERDIYAHNCSFDIGVLEHQLKRHDLHNKFPWPRNHHCTVEISYCIKNKRLKNSELYKIMTGKELKNAHRAKNDVLCLVESIVEMKKQGFIK